ncbi:MAG: HlyD family efflux transporter periplasmic adaptor subunit, partial [Anaerolineales bacterium]|nr:HlyD family efflux transporter periplasmic adaptor subunit [Anaerolineales bacterium]
FNAIVQEKHVDVGATVGTNSALVTLIGTDQAWIVLKVPVNKLRWITVPEKNGDTGSNVTVFSKIWGPDRFRIGHVLRLYGELEQQGRLAQLLVVVDDPFCLKPENHGKPELLMGSLVSAEIEGHTLPQVFPVERSYVRDDDTLWIMNDANELEIRPVEIVYRGVDRIYITKGLSEGERLVLTDIGAPVEGMPLRVADDQDEIAESAPVVSGKSEGRS